MFTSFNNDGTIVSFDGIMNENADAYAENVTAKEDDDLVCAFCDEQNVQYKPGPLDTIGYEVAQRDIASYNLKHGDSPS